MDWTQVDHQGKGGPDCWPWVGNDADLLTTRVQAYESRYGAIGEDLSLYDHCSNDRCCNPFHLFTGYRPLGDTWVFKEGDRVLVTGLLHKPHTGRVRNVGRRDVPFFLGSQDFTMVDVDLPNGTTVAHQFFLDDDRLSPLQ